MYKIILALALIFVSSNVLAFKWGVNTTITGYYAYADGGAFIRVAQSENPDHCTSGAYLALDTSAPNFNVLYSTVMAAHASQKTVTLNYNGCLGDYPKINSVAVPAIW